MKEGKFTKNLGIVDLLTGQCILVQHKQTGRQLSTMTADQPTIPLFGIMEISGSTIAANHASRSRDEIPCPEHEITSRQVLFDSHLLSLNCHEQWNYCAGPGIKALEGVEGGWTRDERGERRRGGEFMEEQMRKG